MYTDSGFVKLDEIVCKAISDLQSTALTPYVWFLTYAIDAVRKLKYNIYPEYKEVKRTMPATKMLDYPGDMVGWLRIGYKDGDRIVAIVHDTSIVRDNERPQDDSSYIPDELYDRLRTGDVNRDDCMVYLHGHNTAGYFKDNKQKRRFEFSADVFADQVIIQYIGSCQDFNTEIEVPSIALDYIVSFIHYRAARFTLGAAHKETEASRRENQREAEELRAQISDLSYEGVVQAMQRSMTMSTKY